MAVTITKTTGLQTSDIRSLLARGSGVWVGTIAFDSSYPTAGESVSLPFTPDFVIAEPTAGYVFSWDYANKKLLAYYYDYDGVADGVAIQVANETDLSAVTVRLLALKV